MDRPTAIPQHVWDSFPDEARGVISALVEGFERRSAELEERLNRHSSNSSQPPSADPIGVKRKPHAPPSKRRRRGQQNRGVMAYVTECLRAHSLGHSIPSLLRG